MLSAHLTGHALDLVPYYDYDGDGSLDLWDWRLYDRLGPIGEQVASSMKLPIIWGGRWQSFKDGPHWQLDPRKYPWDLNWRSEGITVGGKYFPPLN